MNIMIWGRPLKTNTKQINRIMKINKKNKVASTPELSTFQTQHTLIDLCIIMLSVYKGVSDRNIEELRNVDMQDVILMVINW